MPRRILTFHAPQIACYFSFIILIFCIFTKTGITDDPLSSLANLSLFEKSETIESSKLNVPHQLAYWPIIPETDVLLIDGVQRAREIDYSIDYNLGQLTIKSVVRPESIILISYQVIPLLINRSYQRQLFKPLELPPEQIEKPVKDKEIKEIPSTLNYSGSKTVSVSMESLRGLTINQPTRLNVSGKVSESVNVTAILSDEDLPLQPEGTTEELEDLDRILIKIEGRHLSATLGDYEAGFGDTEFVLFSKMLEGAQAQGEFDIGGFTLLGAVSKGQSSSVTIQGIEGQNEYRISVDGKFIIMIAGSETVWLNGEKMRRGEENDYIISDYGDPTVEFTNRHLITSRDVIVVDFEYLEEDLNYQRNLYGTRGKVNIPLMSFPTRPLILGVSYATESDDKDNPLILLTSEDISNLKKNELDPDGNGVNLPAPAEHSVLGFDSSLSLGQIVNLKGEVAFSKRDNNTLSIYDEPEEGRAWKFNGSSEFDRIRINLDFRHLDSNFIPVGSTLISRTRGTYQEDYSNKDFGETQTLLSSVPFSETSYDLGLWFEPLKYVELKGDFGRTSNEYRSPLTPLIKGGIVSTLLNKGGIVSTLLNKGGIASTSLNKVGIASTSLNKGEIVSTPLNKGGIVSTPLNKGGEGGSEDRVTTYWSRSLKLALPDVPKVSNRYQEVTTDLDGQEDTKKSREIWEINHQFWKKMQIGAKNEEIIQLKTSSDDDNHKTLERQLTFQVSELKNFSISSKYSHEEEHNIQNPTTNIQQPTSSAYTLSSDLMFRPKSWLDFSGYFARRQFNNVAQAENSELSTADETPASSTTNLADFKLNISPLRINYQIDKKLSSKQEEVYVNYLLTAVDGREEKRYLLPGEGNYVKVDDFTYREDDEKGDYIRLVRTVGDIPVTSVALQTVFSFQPRSLFRARQMGKTDEKRHFIINLFTRYLSIFETGIRISEEQESASRGFYFLREKTDKTIYGLNRYWFRTQISPAKWLLVMGNWDMGNNVNKRVNNLSRELKSDRWNIGVESPLAANFSLGGKWEADNSYETISNLDESGSVGTVSDISELQDSQSVFVTYRPARILSRLRFEGKYETESDDDALQDEQPVFTKTSSIGSEATWSFRNVGTAITGYKIARGTSTGDLPFARYDFHKGISHKIRLEIDYRIKWFTDVVARLIYRGEIAQDDKPDHRLSVEMTANF